jgi:hypothetical protein
MSRQTCKDTVRAQCCDAQHVACRPHTNCFASECRHMLVQVYAHGEVVQFEDYLHRHSACAACKCRSAFDLIACCMHSCTEHFLPQPATHAESAFPAALSATAISRTSSYPATGRGLTTAGSHREDVLIVLSSRSLRSYLSGIVNPDKACTFERE